MSETSYEHQRRGIGRELMYHTALLKNDFTLGWGPDAGHWDVLSGIADELPPSGRDWGPIATTKSDMADLDYALHLGMLELAAEITLGLYPIDGKEGQYEFVGTACDIAHMEIVRHFPMHFIVMHGEDDIYPAKSIEIHEETDEYFLVKIKKGEM
jgi:hypothetical protein